MALGVGIVGLPNVGKSTLFNAITRAGAVAANYPFATIDKNVGIVTLPDERLDALAKVYTKGDRVPPLVPTIVEFVDIAGLVKGAHKGEGLGNQFLANIREVAAVAHVVRCFESEEIIHVEGHVDPVGDAVTINLELALADLQILEKRLDRLKKNAKSSKDDALLVPLVESLVAHLSEGKPARTFVWNDPEALAKFYKESGLLTAKPMVYVANVPDSDLPDGGSNPHYATLKKMAEEEGMDVVAISAQIEAELSELDPEEALVFLNDLGLSEPGMNSLVRVAFRLLGLQTFLTAGEKEVRAWTIRQGDKAPTAAGVIHTDLERTFIRALVIDWTKLVEAGSIAASRDRGWLRTEGKDYIMQDGDVVEFLCSG
ncbi:redox-regulated ATPase YchF [Armatimonas sp.]|uniref:redox-regulated ATPase YchF n=1 Tax=Armatimonas sp. TaxID=1872638 RepID=UPI00286CED8F|nr:redox-regulated ATPase YchF [Armatimonas sp.]